MFSLCVNRSEGKQSTPIQSEEVMYVSGPARFTHICKITALCACCQRLAQGNVAHIRPVKRRCHFLSHSDHPRRTEQKAKGLCIKENLTYPLSFISVTEKHSNSLHTLNLILGKQSIYCLPFSISHVSCLPGHLLCLKGDI